MSDTTPLPPREYAERALGKAASSEQLDKLFELHPDAYPVVRHSRERGRRGGVDLPCCEVRIYDHKPTTPSGGPPAVTLAKAKAVCNPKDQWNRRIGLSIAFGRALKNLGIKVRMEAGDRAAVH